MPRKKKKSKKTAVFIIITLALAGVIYYYFKIRPVDYTNVSQQIDGIINEELVKLGVAAKDLIKIYREEKKKNNVSWVLVTKEVRVPREINMESYKKSLVDSLRRIGAQLYEAELSDKGDWLSMKIGKHSLVMQNLLLRYPLARYRVSIVIDDLGQRKDLVKNFLRLDIPLTFAILPQLPYSNLLARELKNSGYETILHLPMESEGYPETDPGPGALLVSMDSSQIESTILMDLKTVPGVSGVSNHEGSRFTVNREKMVEALSVLKREGIFFFDSKTSPRSVGEEVARELRMPALSNQIFLDTKNEYKSICRQLERLRRRVLKFGTGIGIGHVHKKFTADALAEYIPRFKEDGIEFVSLSELLK
ncbi:MAG: divergent polysaccharide deacetylase family protein [bacterium]